MRKESKASNGGFYMIKTIQSFKEKVRKLSQETGLSHNQITQNFMFEKFLDRLSVSNYKNNFIIKGGCLLSSIMGIDMRTTMDIDTNITGLPFTLENITKMISEIIITDIDDNVSFQIVNIEEIKEQQEYDGYRFTLLCKFENIKVNFHIDISTGDIITPRAIEYSYKKILENEYISVMAYNNETILAEKIQSILDKKVGNSRMKDFYDIYYFVNYRYSDLNLVDLKDAIIKTFNHRDTFDDIQRSKTILSEIEENVFMNQLWDNYRKKYNYANNIQFADCISSIKKIINIII